MSNHQDKPADDLKHKSSGISCSSKDTTVDWENYYSEAEKEKLRKKGINPALKAEMDHHMGRTKGSQGKGIWQKIERTPFGGSQATP
ncbi:hypothetical protein TruAng_005605 [Truncatella angustata]|nr:hypothetical protein TruAng_005605 [Truncatella angustata]